MRIGIKKEKELEIFYNNLMQKVNVSGDDYYQKIRSKNNCQKYSHIQYNHNSGMNYICLDCDHNVFETLEDKNIYPNLIALNKDNNKGHIFVRFNSFVGTTANSEMKPQRTARLLNHSLNNYLRCDKQFTGVQAKNPLNTDKYRVYSYSQDGYDFNELFDNIPDEFIFLNDPYKVVIEEKELLLVNVGERNAYLFDTVRIEAYKLKYKFNEYNKLYDEVKKIYLSVNSKLKEPLSVTEANHSIKSITNYVFYRYTGDQKNRGVLNLNAHGHNLNLQDKQVLGAKYTHKTQRMNTEQVLLGCIAKLQEEGKKITQKAVAELSGKSLRTVKTYWKSIC